MLMKNAFTAAQKLRGYDEMEKAANADLYARDARPEARMNSDGDLELYEYADQPHFLTNT